MKIMIIRHAEKPDASSSDHGVTSGGKRDKHDLSVTGWQRAGALPRFFAPGDAPAAHADVATPGTVFAARATRKSKSRRAINTVAPLGKLLGLTADDRHKLGEEKALAAAARAAAMPVLIAWHHDHIPDLARAITGPGPSIPTHWPDDRFDMIWVLDADDQGSWRFGQVPQMLLPGDRATPIA